MNEYVTVGQYLATRLTQCGGVHLFGLPGDFNLTLLDEMLTVDGLVWVGNANELNASYAADAYARTTRGVAAVVTTFGVGELSAINGIAGSFAEDVPVVHVGGLPSTSARNQGALLHHTLADGDFDHFVRAYAEVTAASSVLRAEGAGDEIDRVLRVALDRSKPVYLGIPVDVAAARVPSAPLNRPLRTSPSDPHALADFRAALENALSTQPEVTVLAGMRVHRKNLERTLTNIADHPGVRIATQAGAKALLPEAHPASIGTYMGGMTVSPVTRAAVDDASLLILAGTVFSDVQTGVFSQEFETRDVIELQFQNARISTTTFFDVHLEDSLALLDNVIEERRFDAVVAPDAATSDDEANPFDDSEPLTQRALWRVVQRWLPENSIVIADSGTALMGCLELHLPSGTELLAQPIWGSIGYTLPATLGTSLAAPARRSILFIGDGAAQLTIQELATVLHRGLCPIVVLLNNNGYTIERMIQSPAAAYQDITPWDWTALPAAFAPGVAVSTGSASTVGELTRALSTASATTDRLVFIEAKLDAMDAPPLLTQLGLATARANAGR